MMLVVVGQTAPLALRKPSQYGLGGGAGVGRTAVEDAGLVSAGDTQSTEMCIEESDVTYGGSIYHWTEANTANPRGGCCDLCKEDAECGSWTLWGNKNSMKCVLMRGPPQKRWKHEPNPDFWFVSGYAATTTTTTTTTKGLCTVEWDVEYTGANVPGDDAITQMKPGHDHETCCAFCMAHPQCRTWTFFAGECILKSGKEGRQAGRPGHISGYAA